uniref:Uncharacterized protein n=1 Tax=Chlamydomonas leiostraca TaxID=1034604 RepID=A0A7S0RJT2_9CHLO
MDTDDEDEDASSSSTSSSQAVLDQSLKGRIFMVERVEKATGGYRPNFLFVGLLFDIHSHPGGGHHLQQVQGTQELQLSLRYEPPSPKFSRSMQGMASYRLKLLQGPNFIYLLRGLPKTLVLDRSARAVGWGALQLVFHTGSQLDSFLAALRHVDVVQDHLWPRNIAALWRVTSSDGGAHEPPPTSGPASSSWRSSATAAGTIPEELRADADSSAGASASAHAPASSATAPQPSPRAPSSATAAAATGTQGSATSTAGASAAAKFDWPSRYARESSSSGLMWVVVGAGLGLGAWLAMRHMHRAR